MISEGVIIPSSQAPPKLDNSKSEISDLQRKVEKLERINKELISKGDNISSMLD